MSDTVVTIENIVYLENFIQKIDELVLYERREEVGELSNKVDNYIVHADDSLLKALQNLKHYMKNFAYYSVSTRVYLWETTEFIQNWCNNRRKKLN